MTRSEEKAKRRWWKRRFSVRTLTISVAVVSAYFGAWEATKRNCTRDNHFYQNATEEIVSLDLSSRFGVTAVPGTTVFRVISSWAPAPCVIVEEQHVITFNNRLIEDGHNGAIYSASSKSRRAFYLWPVVGRLKFFQYHLPMGGSGYV